MSPEDVEEKLTFAKRRRTDFVALIERNALGTEVHERQQITQEFFVHLIGATEYVAQVVNEQRHIGLTRQKVTITKVARMLAKSLATDPLITALKSLYVNIEDTPFPFDPYCDDGFLYRAYNYRHEVTHRRRNPFHFVMSDDPGAAYFYLDPRDPSVGKSIKRTEVDMQSMFDIVANRCRVALNLL